MIPGRTIATVIVMLALGAIHGPLAQERVAKQAYLLVHGAWGGGWDWQPVSEILTSNGHRVFRVTLTGLGERAHLAPSSVGLGTHISDVMNTILYENLHDVTLVGHSYGGMVVTGVADRIPERIAHLGTLPPMDVPQPLKTFNEAIVLENPLRDRIPTTYILTVDLGAETDRFDPYAARTKAKGWRVERLTADHNPQRSARKELCALLERDR